MTVADLIEGARNQLRANDNDACIDAAALAHARATDDATRAVAAILAARAFLAKGIPPDAILWLDPVLARDPGNALALAYRGWAQRESDRGDLAQADLDAAATLPGAPACAHYYRGLLLVDRDRKDEAMSALGDAAPDAELGTLALCKRAELRLEADDRDGAIADFLAAARRDDRAAAARLYDLEALPDEPAVVIAAAFAARAHEDEPRALAMIAPWLDGDALSPELRARALRLRGLAANAARDFAGAAEHYLAAAAAIPEDAGAQTEAGFALWNVDRADEATAALERALALGQRDGRPELWLAELAFAAQRWDAALELYDRALVRLPRHADALWGRALALGHLGRDDDQRAAMIEAAIAGASAASEWCSEHEITPAPAHFANADVGLRFGNYYAADTNYRFAADGWLAATRAPGDYCARHAAMALSNACYAKSLTGDRAGAVVLGKRAVELRPGFRDGWLNYANQLCGLGQLEEAVRAYERAEWCHPYYAGSHYGRADALRRLGRADESLAALQSAAKIGYEDQGRDNDIHYRLARTYQAMGAWDDARTEYQHLDDVGMMPDETPAMLEAIDTIEALVDGGAGDLEPAPYRRYGLVPLAWPYENTNHTLRIRFAAAPGVEDKVNMASAAAAALAETGLTAEGQTWLWSERFVFITLDGPESGPEEAFEALAAIFFAVETEAEHDVVEVVGLGAIGVNDGDTAEAWSIATQPVPDAGPEYGHKIAFWVPRIGDTTRFPVPAADAAVDQMLNAAREKVAMAAAQQRAAAATKRAERGELIVVPLAPAADGDAEDGETEAAGTPRMITFKKGDEDWGTFAASGAGIMLRRYEGYYTGVDRVTPDGQVHEVVPLLGADPLLMRHVGSLALSPEGGRALWATNLERDVWTCDLATGERKRLLEGLPKIDRLAFLDDGLIMVKTNHDVRLYAERPEGMALRALAPCELGPAYPWRGGKAIVCCSVTDPEVIVFGWSHGMLGRLAEISVEINGYSSEVADDRVVFSGGDVPYELVNLEQAWQRYDGWAGERAAERAAATGLVAEVDGAAPSPGIQEGSHEARSAVAWLATGAAGIAFGLVSTDDGGYRVVAADDGGAHEITPAIVGPSFQWDWSFDQRGVIVVNHGRVHEVDLAGRTSRELTIGGVAERACYVHGGYAVVEDTELVLYRRQGDVVEEAGRMDLACTPDEMGVARAEEHGDVVFVRQGEVAVFLAIDVATGEVRVMGSLELGDYFTAYLREGVLYVQNTYEGSGTPVRRHRVRGLAEARAAAMGTEAIEVLEWEEVEAGSVFGSEEYDGVSVFNAKADEVSDDDDDDDEVSDDDDDEDEDDDHEDADDEDEDDDDEDDDDE